MGQPGRLIEKQSTLPLLTLLCWKWSQFVTTSGFSSTVSLKRKLFGGTRNTITLSGCPRIWCEDSYKRKVYVIPTAREALLFYMKGISKIGNFFTNNIRYLIEPND